ncbi:MAG: glycosyltransferase [Candidatus Magasanikbacteria bacterium]|nr:glycosyltransferase [Candidatus Magasanikbacteria bacterium]
MRLSIHLVVWNGAKYVPHLFDSLRKQTFLDWQLLVIDNNSTDNTLELIKKELENFPVTYQIIENKENLGFAGGQNLAFKKTDTEYFLMLNQDMYLMPDCLERIIKFLDSHADVAAVSPRLMKWNFNNIQHGLQNSFTDQVDSLGLKVYRNRRVVEQYAQADWLEISDELLGQGNVFQVFGISGALPVFRRSIIKGILYEDGTIFDESYHSYKEDVDLAYRLIASGNMACVLLDALAFHDRSAAGSKQAGDVAALINKQSQSELVKYHSYKNHIASLYKNEYWQNFILDLPWILWYELKKFVYFLLFDRQVLAGLKEVFAYNLVGKRKYIKQLRKVDWKQVRVWWN